MRLSFFSTRAAQEAQVIPPMSSSASASAGSRSVGALAVVLVMSVLQVVRGAREAERAVRAGGGGVRPYVGTSVRTGMSQACASRALQPGRALGAGSGS
ncbi:hypothetical protein SVIOM74S_00624 [Streptomyces violarus]